MVDLVGVTMVDQYHVAIIMPRYEYSIRDYVKDEKNVITIQRALRWMYQTSLGFEYLIQKNGLL